MIVRLIFQLYSLFVTIKQYRNLNYENNYIGGKTITGYDVSAKITELQQIPFEKNPSVTLFCPNYEGSCNL